MGDTEKAPLGRFYVWLTSLNSTDQREQQHKKQLRKEGICLVIGRRHCNLVQQKIWIRIKFSSGARQRSAGKKNEKHVDRFLLRKVGDKGAV